MIFKVHCRAGNITAAKWTMMLCPFWSVKSSDKKNTILPWFHFVSTCNFFLWYLWWTSSCDICDELLPKKLFYDIFKKPKELTKWTNLLKGQQRKCSIFSFLRTYYICMLNCVLYSSLNTFPPESVYCQRTLLSNLSQKNAYFFYNIGVRNIS